MYVVLSCMAVYAADAVFNVATYNLRLLNDDDSNAGNGWHRRCPHVADLIRFHGFDIFGTQEGVKSQLDDLLERLPGYAYIGVGREDGLAAGEHAAIFYDTSKFEVLEHGDFWLSETPEQPGFGWDAVCKRICTWGIFRHKASGKSFIFYNLHMDHRGTVARVESARLIRRRIVEAGHGLPVLLTGDFNVDQHSPSYATITEGNLLADTHQVAEFVYEATGTFNAYSPTCYTDSRIDHVFVSPGIRVLRYGILTDTYRAEVENAESRNPGDAPPELQVKTYEARTPSDHFPVLTTVELP